MISANRAAILSNSSWRIGGQITRIVLQFGNITYLSWILSPEAFGEVAYGLAFIGFGQLFTTAGPTSALIQCEHLDEREIRASMSYHFAAGCATCLIVLLIIPWVTTNVRISRIMAILAGGLVIGSLGTTSAAILQRDLRFPVVVVWDLVSFAFGNVLCVVVLANLGFGSLSLAIGNILGITIRSVALYTARPVTLLPQTKYLVPKRLIRFGIFASLAEAAFFASMVVDVLIVGTFLGTESLGFYTRALYLVRTPTAAVFVSLHHVLFPTFTHVMTSRDKIKQLYCRIVALSFTGLLPVTVFVALMAEPITVGLFGESWRESGALLLIASPLIVTAVSTIGDACLKALGYVRLLLICRLALIGLTTATVYSSVFVGINAVAFAVTLTNVCLLLGVHSVVSKVTAIRFHENFELLALAISTTCISASVLLTLRQLAGELGAGAFSTIIVSFGVPISALLTAMIPLQSHRRVRADCVEIIQHLTRMVASAFR